MSGTVLIGKLLGIDVRIHFSWIIIFALVAISLANSYLPRTYPGWSLGQYWAVGFVGSVLLFVCVLIHEFSHSFEAIRRGLKVSRITLFLLGGVSEIEEESRNASEEFWISFVGPATSLLLALFFCLLYFSLRSLNPQISALVQYLGLVNLFIGLFNLVPAFPLDGGRALRALLWRTTGSETRATSIAGRVGLAFGTAFMGFGMVIMIVTDNLIIGAWLGVIGWFIRSAASTSLKHRTAEARLSGRQVRDAMRKDFPTVEPGVSVQALLRRRMVPEFEPAYVVTLGDTLYGLITTVDVSRILPEAQGRTWVTEAMTRVADLVTLTPDTSLDHALQNFIGKDIAEVVVVEDGKPVGLLSHQDILRVIELSILFPGHEAEPPAER